MNKLEGHGEICTKTQLALNMRAYAQAARVDLSGTIPLTFVVTAGAPGKELESWRKAAAAALSAASSGGIGGGNGGGDMWIVKPGSLNRGRGIRVYKVICPAGGARSQSFFLVAVPGIFFPAPEWHEARLAPFSYPLAFLPWKFVCAPPLQGVESVEVAIKGQQLGTK